MYKKPKRYVAPWHRLIVFLSCAMLIAVGTALPVRATPIIPDPDRPQDFGLIVGAIAVGIVAIAGGVTYKIVTSKKVKKTNKIKLKKKGLELENSFELEDDSEDTSFNSSIETPDTLARVEEDYSLDTTGSDSADLHITHTAFADVISMTDNKGELADFEGTIVTDFTLVPDIADQTGLLTLDLGIDDFLVRIAEVPDTAAEASFSLNVSSPQIGTLFDVSASMLFDEFGTQFLSSGDISESVYGDFVDGVDVGKTLEDFSFIDSFSLPANEPIDIQITFQQKGFSAVPEPPTGALFFVGLFGLLWGQLTCRGKRTLSVRRNGALPVT